MSFILKLGVFLYLLSFLQAEDETKWAWSKTKDVDVMGSARLRNSEGYFAEKINPRYEVLEPDGVGAEGGSYGLRPGSGSLINGQLPNRPLLNPDASGRPELGAETPNSFFLGTNALDKPYPITIAQEKLDSNTNALVKPSLDTDALNSNLEIKKPNRPFFNLNRPFLGANRPFLGSNRPLLGSNRPLLSSNRPHLGPYGPALGPSNSLINTHPLGEFLPDNQFLGPFAPNRPGGVYGPETTNFIGNYGSVYRPGGYRPGPGGYGNYRPLLGRPPIGPGGGFEQRPIQGGLSPFEPPFKNYDTCKCTEKFNCKHPGISYGHCDVGKQYCCYNKHGEIEGSLPPSRPIHSPENGVLVGPGGPYDVPNRLPYPGRPGIGPQRPGLGPLRPGGGFGLGPGNPGVFTGPGGGHLGRPLPGRPLNGIYQGPGGPYDQPYGRPLPGVYNIGKSVKDIKK